MSHFHNDLPSDAHVRRKENTRARLIRASANVFVDKGIDAATIDDIVQAAGFTRGAFYSNFSRKEEVFYALFAEVTDEVIHIIEAQTPADAAPEAPPSSPVSEDAMVQVFQAIRPYGRQWYLLYNEALTHALRHHDARPQLMEQRGRIRDAIVRTYAAGLKSMNAHCLVPMEHFADMMLAIHLNLVANELMADIDQSHTAGMMIRHVVETFSLPGAPRH
ncbi:TetR/AcrR family transcriptional regulator [Devriesea agamarum]|uniref:TetR/AcrR family transcriptional regulator n=1 Tax=Devriesea agamarum TaxID=472569 RepID=UPI00071DD846|nr:TetR/AcrR family transcriptional regulator [Devriesea agamarum]